MTAEELERFETDGRDSHRDPPRRPGSFADDEAWIVITVLRMSCSIDRAGARKSA